MTGIGNRRTALAFIFGLAALSPVAARADDAVDKKLDSCVDFKRPIYAKLDDLFDYMSKRYQITLQVDKVAFQSEKMKYDGALKASLPSVPSIRMRTGLEWVLDQANLRYEVRDNKVMIIPMTRAGKEVAFPPAKFKLTEREAALKKTAAQSTNVDRPVDASLEDVVSWLEDRFDVIIMVDQMAFVRQNKDKRVAETRIKFPANPITLRDALEHLAVRAGGIVEYRDDHIRITAKPEK